MSPHEAMREVADKASTAAITAGTFGSVYNLFLENPIGFVCAVVTVATFAVNWYYKHKDERRKQEQHERNQ